MVIQLDNVLHVSMLDEEVIDYFMSFTWSWHPPFSGLVSVVGKFLVKGSQQLTPAADVWLGSCLPANEISTNIDDAIHHCVADHDSNQTSMAFIPPT